MAAVNEHAGELASYQAKYPRHPKDSSGRPEKPHSTYNAYEESSINLTPQQAEQNAHADRAAQDFDFQQREARAKANTSSPVRNSKMDADLEAKLQAELQRVNAKPTAKRATRGSGVPTTGNGTLVEALPGKRFGQHLHKNHQIMSGIVNELKASDDPGLQAFATMASVHLHGDPANEEGLDGARDHIDEGDRLLGTVTGQDKGKEHYVKAAQHIKNAADILSHPYVQMTAKKNNINAEVPSMDQTHSAVETLGRKLKSNPFPEMSIGGKPYDANSEQALTYHTNAAKLTGAEKVDEAVARTVTKSNLARRGSSRGGFKVDRTTPLTPEERKALMDNPNKLPKNRRAEQAERTGDLNGVPTPIAGPHLPGYGTAKKNLGIEGAKAVVPKLIAQTKAPTPRLSKAEKDNLSLADRAKLGTLPRSEEGEVTSRERNMQLVTGKASKERRTAVFHSAAQNNVPDIMGKPEIGPDVGSQVTPELPKPTKPVVNSPTQPAGSKTTIVGNLSEGVLEKDAAKIRKRGMMPILYPTVRSDVRNDGKKGGL
jgi:hypothetical protein